MCCRLAAAGRWPRPGVHVKFLEGQARETLHPTAQGASAEVGEGERAHEAEGLGGGQSGVDASVGAVGGPEDRRLGGGVREKIPCAEKGNETVAEEGDVLVAPPERGREIGAVAEAMAPNAHDDDVAGPPGARLPVGRAVDPPAAVGPFMSPDILAIVEDGDGVRRAEGIIAREADADPECVVESVVVKMMLLVPWRMGMKRRGAPMERPVGKRGMCALRAVERPAEWAVDAVGAVYDLEAGTGG